jgi:hypothetical protein
MHITPSEILLLVKLFLAHILTDFVFQTKASIKRKEKNIGALIWHGAFTAIVTTALFATSSFEGGKFYLFTLTLCSHTLIDWLKTYLSKKNDDAKRKLYLFLGDQAAHILVILFFWLTFLNKLGDIGNWFTETANTSYIVAYATGYIFLTLPAGILIGELMKVFHFKNTDNAGLPSAGQAIGIIERIIIFTCVLVNQYTAIGFLVAAKSILRIKGDGDDGEVKTEYIIIGTLLSFGIAIITGELAKLIT